ncbi:hypothetical protein [Nocardia sp. NPDC057030]|uniref:hypothetical protein n=1 Tax=unclassified Nocardia TaxID=2637762 RepID=UPI00362C911B
MDAVEFGVYACVGLAIVAPAALVLVPVRDDRRRRNALWEWTTANNWTCTQNAHADWTARLPGGDKGRLGLAMTGRLGGRWVTVADYNYQTTRVTYDSDNNRSKKVTTHHYSVVVVHLDRPYPPIAVVPRGPLAQLSRAVFGDKPTATGNHEFDSRYRVRTSEPDYARWLIGKPLIDAHLSGEVPHWSLGNHELLTYRAGALPSPAAIPALAAPLLRIADLLPR